MTSYGFSKGREAEIKRDGIRCIAARFDPWRNETLKAALMAALYCARKTAVTRSSSDWESRAFSREGGNRISKLDGLTDELGAHLFLFCSVLCNPMTCRDCSPTKTECEARSTEPNNPQVCE